MLVDKRTIKKKKGQMIYCSERSSCTELIYGCYASSKSEPAVGNAKKVGCTVWESHFHICNFLTKVNTVEPQ